MSLEEYQASFDGEPGYLDWAAFGPLSATVRDEVHADAELLGAGRRAGIEMVAGHLDAARELLADLLDGRSHEVVLQPSTTQGLMHAFYGLSGEMLVSTRDYPGLTVAARRAQQFGELEVTWLDLDDGHVTAGAVADALTASTSALAVSLVDHRTGYRVDLAALRDAIGDDRLLIIDASQAVGILDEDYSLADVVCGHGATWLRAGRGTGFARFSERARERIEPVLSGVAGVDGDPFGDTDPALSPTAAAYSVSAPDGLAAARLASGLREVADVGVAAIESEIAARTGDVIYLADRYDIPVLTPREPERRGGIVTLSPPSAGIGALAASLANHGLTFTARGDLLRISPHVGTGEDTLRLLGDALAGARAW